MVICLPESLVKQVSFMPRVVPMKFLTEYSSTPDGGGIGVGACLRPENLAHLRSTGLYVSR